MQPIQHKTNREKNIDKFFKIDIINFLTLKFLLHEETPSSTKS